LSIDGSASLDMSSLDVSALDVSALDLTAVAAPVMPAPPVQIRTYLAAVPDERTAEAPTLSALQDVEPDRVIRIDRRADDADRADPMAELFTAHYARLAGWCSRLVGDEQLAHEIASEAFTRLLSKWRGVDDVRGYLYVTASNIVKDHWRRLERERRAMTKVEVPTSTPGADEAPPLRDVVERLPNRHRDVVLLHYYADISVKDTARALKVSEGAVKRRLFEARALLHEALEGHR
jgi:RNA polymerase sigma-70 factor (ECF subfamily)